jgi:acylpyruvate hydrolase
MTARGLQNEAKNKGLPWTVAKGYDTFCPVSRFIEKDELPKPENTTLWLKVDNELRQNGSTSDMIFSYVLSVHPRSTVLLHAAMIAHVVYGSSIPFLVSHISSIMTLEEGDLILTGTHRRIASHRYHIHTLRQLTLSHAGTPSGVGPVKPGQRLTAGIEGLSIDMSFDVIQRSRPSA